MSRQQPDDSDAQRMQLAQRLREAREYVGLSQEEVAFALGVSRPAVTNMESGSRKVEAIELDKLTSLYGRTAEYFLTGDSQPTESRVAFFARATQGLSDRDLEELGRFAAFLRNSPKSKRRDPT